MSRDAKALTAVIAASLVAGWLVFTHMVRLDPQPTWDEAAHALQGALVTHDLRAHDLMSLLFDSYRQVWWPPMHSWLLSGAFLIAGSSMETARAVSVLAFVLLVPTLFLVARTVAPRQGVLAGSVSAALALTSPGLIALAAQSMLELPGLLALSLTTLVYCWLERHPDARPRTHMFLGACTTLTYLVKSSCGVLLIISIVLTKLIAAGFRPRRLLTKQNLYAVLPLAVFSAIWFAYLPKVVSTWYALINEASGVEARGLLGLLFYPRAIVHLSGSWWMSVLLWGGLVMAWKNRRQPGIGFLAVLALAQFVIGEFHHTKADRHMLPMFPSMFVLAGVATTILWSWLRPGGWGRRAPAIGLLACVAVLHAATLGRREWSPDEARDATEVLHYISALTREHAPALVIGTRGASPVPPVIDWHLVTSERVPVTAAGSAMDPRQERRLSRAIGGVPVPEGLRESAQRVLGRYDASSATRSLHVGDRLHEDQGEFDKVLASTISSSSPRAIITTIAISDTTPYPTSFIAPGLARAGFSEVSMREFPRQGTRVYVYRRPRMR
jgi:4-amino-4-deoxy-L-arabinose transferase-like glycosyltransferase